MFMEMNKDAYNAYVKEVTPVNPVWKNIVRAFVTGGIICTVGQVMMNWLTAYGMDEKTAGAWNLLALILGSIVLTGFNVYPKIVKWGGAGALVPITGFANSVVSPAIEYRAEGQVFGIGCKIFTIAGPVILYGILASWVLGVIYWVGGVMGVI
jgi:stage V sporulation protein AC